MEQQAQSLRRCIPLCMREVCVRNRRITCIKIVMSGVSIMLRVPLLHVRGRGDVRCHATRRPSSRMCWRLRLQRKKGSNMQIVAALVDALRPRKSRLPSHSVQNAKYIYAKTKCPRRANILPHALNVGANFVSPSRVPNLIYFSIINWRPALAARALL